MSIYESEVWDCRIMCGLLGVLLVGHDVCMLLMSGPEGEVGWSTPRRHH